MEYALLALVTHPDVRIRVTLCFVAFGGLTILVALEPSTSMFDVDVPKLGPELSQHLKPSAVLGIQGLADCVVCNRHGD